MGSHTAVCLALLALAAHCVATPIRPLAADAGVGGQYITIGTLNPTDSSQSLISSQNGGKSWEYYSVPQDVEPYVAIDPTNPLAQIVATITFIMPPASAGVAYSNNGGATWSYIPYGDLSAVGLPAGAVGLLGVASAGNGSFYAAVAVEGGSPQLAVTTNLGTSWTVVNANIPVSNPSQLLNSGVLTSSVGPTPTLALAVTGVTNDIYVSTNAGQTWALGYTSSYTSEWSMAMSSSGQYVAAVITTSTTAVLSSSYGASGSWKTLVLPSSVGIVSAVTMNSIGQYVAISGGFMGDLAVSYDYGITFTTLTPAAGSQFTIAASSLTGRVLAGYVPDSSSPGCYDLWLSTNYGLAWNLTLASTTAQCVQPLSHIALV
eukprot:m.257312 g.257312  ORF g.257312 m.257312 type:complete len:375 (+) comp20781_c0_seq1:165-1289(+)